MKKYFVIAMAVFGLSLISCKDAEEKTVDNYIEKINDAVDDKDFQSAAQLYKELRDYMQSLDVDAERKLMKELGDDKMKAIDDMENVIYLGCKEKGIPFGPDEAAAKREADEEAGEAIEETGGGDYIEAASRQLGVTFDKPETEAPTSNTPSASTQTPVTEQPQPAVETPAEESPVEVNEGF